MKERFHIKIPTDFGNMAAVFEESPFCIRKTILPRKSEDALDLAIEIELALKTKQNKEAQKIYFQLKNFFKGTPITPMWDIMKTDKLTDLQKKTLYKTAMIPYGEVKTYKQIAYEIGIPKASRFVGSVMALNPFPIIVPCHRVVKIDGSYGEFGGGKWMKKALIELELSFCK